MYHINCHDGIGYEEKAEEENLDWKWLSKWNERGAYNEILNELRLSEF